MKNTIYLLVGVAVLLAITFVTPRPVAAQEDVGRLLHQLESDSDRFSKTLDNAMDHSSLNGTAQEGEMTRYVKDFEDAVRPPKGQVRGSRIRLRRRPGRTVASQVDQQIPEAKPPRCRHTNGLGQCEDGY